MFGKKQERPEEIKPEVFLIHNKCKHCQSENVYFLYGGNWVDTSRVQIHKTYGDPNYPDFKQFDILFCSNCGKLSEVETK